MSKQQTRSRAASRLPVQKTLKLYIGGKFPRSESGQVVATKSASGGIVNVSRASRKDLRDAVGTARSAQGPWAARTAYNRGQILYRLAEMLEDRASSMPVPLTDVHAAVDRAVHHAGWADKVSAVLSTLNPVSATYVNYSRIRPLGVVVAFPDPRDGLLGMVEAACASAVMGNGTIVVTPIELGEIAACFAEALATSDLPGGVVNVLTGDVGELLGHASRHDDIDGLYLAHDVGVEALGDAEQQAARVMRRLIRVSGAKAPATPIELQRMAEVQTVWMSAYEPRGGAAAY